MVVAFFSHFRKLLLWVRENYDSRKTRLNSKSLVGNTKKTSELSQDNLCHFFNSNGWLPYIPEVYEPGAASTCAEISYCFASNISQLETLAHWSMCNLICIMENVLLTHALPHFWTNTAEHIFKKKKLNSGCTRINKLTQSHSKKCTVLLVVCAAFWAFSKGRVPLWRPHPMCLFYLKQISSCS